jgi:hypothetical protein
VCIVVRKRTRFLSCHNTTRTARRTIPETVLCGKIDTRTHCGKDIRDSLAVVPRSTNIHLRQPVKKRDIRKNIVEKDVETARTKREREHAGGIPIWSVIRSMTSSATHETLGERVKRNRSLRTVVAAGMQIGEQDRNVPRPDC